MMIMIKIMMNFCGTVYRENVAGLLLEFLSVSDQDIL